MCVSQSGYDLFDREREREILSEEGGEGKLQGKKREEECGCVGGDFTEMTLSGLGEKRSVTARMGVEGNMVMGHGLKVFPKVATWKVSKKDRTPICQSRVAFFSLSFFLSCV